MHLSNSISWAHFYDLTTESHVAAYLEISGLAKYVRDAADADSPFDELQKLDAHPDYQEWPTANTGEYELRDLISVLFSLSGTLNCLMLHGCYITDFIGRARETGDDALLNAIRVDPVAESCVTASNRISRAVAAGDVRFLNKLQNAMLGKSGKQRKYLKKFRYLMQVLFEAGALQLPTKDLSELAIHLGTYIDSPTAHKNLQEEIRKFRKLKHI